MLAYPPVIVAYCTFVVAVMGLAMGSFLNCLAWRMTHGESALKGRSHCTSCGHVLGARDLVPVLSWLQTRGRCRYCGERVSVRYPATELVCCVAYVSILFAYGLSAQTVELLAFWSVLLVLSLTDLDDYLIPNATIVAALIIRVLYLLYIGMNARAGVGGLLWASALNGLVVAAPIQALALVMDRFLGRDSLGGGDVKLLFVAGTYFGWQQCLFLVMLACVLGICLGMIVAPRGKGSGDADAPAIPFGPAIALACWACMLVGGPVTDWYFGLF